MKTYRLATMIFLPLAMILLIAGGQAGAYQATVVYWELADAEREGPVILSPGTGFDTSVNILLKNRDQRYGAIVLFPSCSFDPEPGGVYIENWERMMRGEEPVLRQAAAAGFYEPSWQACFPDLAPFTHKVYVPPSGEARVEMAIDFRRAGKIQVLVFAQVYVVNPERFHEPPEKPAEFADVIRSAGINAAILPIDLYFKVVEEEAPRGVFTLSSYVELFVPTLRMEEEGIGTFDVLETRGQIPFALEEYQICRPRPSDEYNPEIDRSRVRQIQLSSGLGEQDTCEEPRPNPCTRPSISIQPGVSPDLSPAVSPQLRGSAADPTFTLSGNFSVKWTDHALHPAFGWRVRAWWNSPSGWRNMAEDWIQWGGNWQLVFSYPGYTGQKLRVQYVAFNRYFTPQTTAGGTYRWKGPDRTNISQTHNEGAWYADCDGNDVHGLGEVYHEGMTMWSRLYWTGEINPLRSSSLKLYFPNTTFDCGDGSGVPWSCAAKDGRVWLIAAHALRNGVVQHEFGHQLNYEYWSNKLPAGSGGGHNLWSCYNTGLALTEGFANFMPFWVQHQARSSAPNAADFDFDVESPSGACQDETNEVWVASTFWDLHDSHADGNDILWYVHKGAVMAIFLSNGIASDGDSRGMSDYRIIYRNRCSSGHETYIDNIFNQNHTD